ncbi:MAG: hypothetical protein KDE31_35545, partial [Caldilineaceae bacterium]|nr:hypothetical protein [Caldilineaceae bacterium]
MAILTRSPGIFLLPFAALVLLLQWLRLFWPRNETPNTATEIWSTTTFLLTSFVLWLLVVAVVFVLLWPAMWVAPLDTLRAVFRAAGDYAEAGHDDPIFFNGAIYNGDPGISFYPLTLLWRTTPVVWLGLVLAGVSLVFTNLNKITRQAEAELVAGEEIPASTSSGITHLSDLIFNGHKLTGVKRDTILLALFALGFWLLMNLGAKKFDRYLLPAYSALDLIAGVGFVTAGVRLQQRWLPRLGHYTQPLLIAVLILLQAAAALPHYPYYLTYYNPLLGGGKAAVAVMQIGRGEGANRAADYLNRQLPTANQQSAIAASAFPNGPFSYFFQGRTVPPSYWSMADDAVGDTGILQRQRPWEGQVVSRDRRG